MPYAKERRNYRGPFAGRDFAGSGNRNAKIRVRYLFERHQPETGKQLFDLFYQEARHYGHSWRMDWARRNRGYFDNFVNAQIEALRFFGLHD